MTQKSMKIATQNSLLIKALVLLFALGLGVSCAPTLDPTSGIWVQIPWFNSGKEYSLDWVQLQSVRSFQPLRSTYVNIYQSPAVHNNRIKGTNPTLRLSQVSQNHFVPIDMQTAELVAITAHFERLAEFDKKVGVFEVTRWPVDVGIAVKYLSENGELEKNNAVYEGNLDALLVVPYNRPDLPLSLNGGVLDHEHFHAIFQRLVLNPISEKIAALKDLPVHKLGPIYEAFGVKPTEGRAGADLLNYQYTATLIRGMNEGMADFWGWLYLADTNFVKRSLSQEGRREIVAKSSQVWSTGELRGKVEVLPNEDNSMFRAYELGSLYAQNMRTLTEEIAQKNDLSLPEAKLVMAKALVKGLKSLATKFNSLSQDQLLAPFTLVDLVVQSLPAQIRGACVTAQPMLSSQEGMVLNCEGKP